MKVAFLITAYNHYDHLRRLVDALQDEHSTFFIHIDGKSPMPANLRPGHKIRFIKRIKVWWGGWSHQQAILNLMKEAVRERFDYYCLISGTDYPIRPKSFFYDKLREGGEYFSFIKGFSEDKPESRVQYYYFDGFDRRRRTLKTKVFLKFESLVRKLRVKRNYPFKEVYHGSTWWALSHDCIQYVLSFLKSNPAYTRFFKTSFCPEETFIHTILGNSPFKNKSKGYLTYTDWSANWNSPEWITEKHVDLFKEQELFEVSEGEYHPYFARKFSDGSKDIVKKIDRELRIDMGVPTET
jgi:hypothetical protein